MARHPSTAPRAYAGRGQACLPAPGGARYRMHHDEPGRWRG